MKKLFLMLFLLTVVTSIDAQISDVVQKSNRYVVVYNENNRILYKRYFPEGYELVGFGKDFFVIEEYKKRLSTYDENGRSIHNMNLPDGYKFKSAGGNSIQIKYFNKYIYTYDKNFRQTGQRRID